MDTFRLQLCNVQAEGNKAAEKRGRAGEGKPARPVHTSLCGRRVEQGPNLFNAADPK
jgi:hypothetical protein